MMQELQSTFWDREVLIEDIKTSEHGIIRICVVQKNNKAHITHREFYNTKEDPTWRAGKNGGKIEIAEGIKFANAVIEAVKAAATLGLAKAE